jgi:hypothetical protein
VLFDVENTKEDEMTKEYMLLYGIDNVRGGANVTVILDEHRVNLIKREFKTAEATLLKIDVMECKTEGLFF